MFSMASLPWSDLKSQMAKCKPQYMLAGGGITSMAMRIRNRQFAIDNRQSRRSIFQLPQPQPKCPQLLLDLIEAGLPEVFAAQQLRLRAAGQFADGGDVEPLQCFAAADRELEVDH